MLPPTCLTISGGLLGVAHHRLTGLASFLSLDRTNVSLRGSFSARHVPGLSSASDLNTDSLCLSLLESPWLDSNQRLRPSQDRTLSAELQGVKLSKLIGMLIANPSISISCVYLLCCRFWTGLLNTSPPSPFALLIHLERTERIELSLFGWKPNVLTVKHHARLAYYCCL